MQTPLVSVIMTTYNHAPYLRRAVEGVLSQECDFDYELILSDDLSTDGTLALCRAWEREHPGRVRVLSSTENVGWRENYRRCLEAARGRYVAYCDGDDWWEHPRKLQMQADYLASHPRCGMCFTRVHDYYAATDTLVEDDPQHYTDFDRLLLRLTISNCSTMAHRTLVAGYYAECRPELHPEWLTEDAAMWLWFAARGDVGYLPEFTAVHRRLTRSVSQSDDYRRRMAFCDSLMDISLYMDARYTSSRHRFAIERKRSSVALWVLSHNGGIGEYLGRWWRDVCRTPRLLLCPEGAGLFLKKVLWRMWRRHPQKH